MLYDVKKAKAVGGYCDGHSKNGGNTQEDQNLFKRLKQSGANITHIEEGLLFYRRHKENFNSCK
jgi:hypothetical protein